MMPKTNKLEKFEKQKKSQLSKKDKSNIQKWDKKITPLLNKINQKKDFYTTSSCSGRIVLIKASDKKKPNLFLFRTHNKTNFQELKKQLNVAIKKCKYLIYFKQEACGLHVACSCLEKAQEILNKAKNSGWKNSGIIATKKRIICHFRSTEKIELPIANNGKIIVSDDYFKLLIKEANKKLEKSWKKIRKFEKNL